MIVRDWIEGASVTGVVAIMLVVGLTPFASAGIPIPGGTSPDMTLYAQGQMAEYGSMGCGNVYYAVWRSLYNDRNHWVGRARTDKTGTFCDIVSFDAKIRVFSGQYPGTTGSDPYSHLPRQGQTWTYQSNDGFTNADAIGALPGQYAEWVALYWTSVPWSGVPWNARQEPYGYYNWHWWASGGCTGGWDEMREGLGSTDGHDDLMEFTMVYSKGGCWFGGMHGTAYASVYLLS